MKTIPNFEHLEFNSYNLKCIIGEIWQNISPNSNSSSWIDSIQISINNDQKQLLIKFPHKFFANWFFQNIQKDFENIIHEYIDNNINLEYDYKSFSEKKYNYKNKYQPNIVHKLDPEYSFNNFIVNKKNYFPYISAKEIAEQNEINYNPFLLSGDSSTGKTHLLKSIANEFEKKYDSENILFSTVEDLYHLYQSQRNNSLTIRNYLCSFEILILDELQQINKYEDLQQELILIFNHFHRSQKQMIFGCNGKLASFESLDPKLKSRLEWGLIVHMKKPDLDIRVQYVKKQSQDHGLSLTKEQILHLAQRFQDLRHLRGITIKLMAYKELMNTDIKGRNFYEILKNLEIKPTHPLDAAQIIRVVANYHELDPEDLKSSKRHHSIVIARQAAMYLCRKLLGYSYPQLGILFGGKDHSTAIYGIKKIKKLQENNKEIKNMLTTLKQKCRSLSEQ